MKDKDSSLNKQDKNNKKKPQKKGAQQKSSENKTKLDQTKGSKELLELKNQLDRFTLVKRTLEKKLDEAETHVKKAQEDSLKYMAELENFKKRKNQEVDTFKKYAAESVIKEILPVFDNFNLACEHANKKDQSEQDIVKGFLLINKQLHSIFEKLNLKPIESVDKPFNPDFHQAISQEKKDGVAPDIVLKEVQKGFCLYDRVIRPSMVIVSQ